MDDKKKTFVIPEAEVVILLDIETNIIAASAGTDGWDDDNNTEVWG